MRLKWNSTLETGIRQIDLQHQELIGIINEIVTAHDEGRDDDVLENVLPRLKAYVIFHFSTEESLMTGLLDGTHARQHKSEHREFGEKVASLTKESRNDCTRTVVELLDYLNSWLLDHIMSIDKELGKHLLALRH
jgi:hemerythrin-like metal-binding protein